MADTTDNVTLRAEATVNGQTCAITVDLPRPLWNPSLTDQLPDTGHWQPVAVKRQQLGFEPRMRLNAIEDGLGLERGTFDSGKWWLSRGGWRLEPPTGQPDTTEETSG